MLLKVDVQDELTPFLQRIIAEKPKWFSSALKSAGYWSQKEIKEGIKSGAPGGQAYASLMPPWMRKKLEKALGNNVRKNYTQSLGRLSSAVGYDKRRANEGIVTVGWLSRSAVYIGSKQEKGFFTEVSERMRKAFNIAGIKIPAGKTQISVKARPTYRPMRAIIQRGARRRVEMKLIDYLKGVNRSSQASSKRVYRVYR